MYDSLQKVAQSLSHMQEERQNREVLEKFDLFSHEDQVKIGRCYVYLAEQETATKVATAEGKEIETPIAFKTASDRLSTAIELAHYQELMNNEEVQKVAAEHAAAGSLAVQLLVEHVGKTEG